MRTVFSLSLADSPACLPSFFLRHWITGTGGNNRSQPWVCNRTHSNHFLSNAPCGPRKETNENPSLRYKPARNLRSAPKNRPLRPRIPGPSATFVAMSISPDQLFYLAEQRACLPRVQPLVSGALSKLIASQGWEKTEGIPMKRAKKTNQSKRKRTGKRELLVTETGRITTEPK